MTEPNALAAWHAHLQTLGFSAPDTESGAPSAAAATSAPSVVAAPAISAICQSETPTDTLLWAPLHDLGVIRASGPEAAAFLQNLLTHDVRTLPPEHSRLAGLCTPKGRLLALFQIVPDPQCADALLLIVPRELLAPVLRKLSLYILRSKVTLTDASAAFVLLGWACQDAALAGAVPPKVSFAGARAWRMNHTDAPALGLLVAPPQAALTVVSTAFADAAPISAEVWRYLEIAAGVPRVLAATQEAFVPQMLNMELRAVDGISFGKGCYPGQEIVARTQYLGKIKRRMLHARLAQAASPGAGVFAPETGAQPCGTLVSVALSPDGSTHALVCVQMGALDGGILRVGAPDGPLLSLLPLPYDLDGPDTRTR